MRPIIILLLVATVFAVWLLGVVGPLTVVFHQAVKNDEDAAHTFALELALNGVDAALDGAVDAVVRASSTLALSAAQAANCELLNLDPRAFNSLPIVAEMRASADLLQGAGVLTYSGSPDNKVSFEIAKGSVVSPPCPDFLYGFTTSNLTYTGYCATVNANAAVTVDYSTPAYTGPDYGLTDAERALTTAGSQQRAAFLPVFDLVGTQSLTYDRVLSQCVPPVLSFAQTNLLLLSEELASLLTDEVAVAYAFELSTGLLTIASNASAVVDVVGGQQTRVAAVNSSDPLIAGSVRALMDAGHRKRHAGSDAHEHFTVDGVEYAVSWQPYSTPTNAEADLGWQVVVGISHRSLLTAASEHKSRVAYILGMIFSLLLITILAVVSVNRFWIGDKANYQRST